MQLLVIILFFLFQFLTGFGILNMLKLFLGPALCISTSVLLGIAVFSIVPFFLQLAFIPLTGPNIFIAIAAICAFSNLKSKNGWLQLLSTLKKCRWRIKLYEIPFLLLISFMVFVSAWRCYYYPPTPRDLTSGAEVIAEYAVKEKTMINSVFTVDLSTTNNQFKPPFITCLQIIYKYAGFPFGQVWLINVFISFVIFLYGVMNLKLHKIITGLLLVIFIAIPEMYAYTVMALFDYSNAVFFCLSLYFLFEFFKNEKNHFVLLAGILMGIATYIRSETLILALLITVCIIFHYWKAKNAIQNIARICAYFILPSLLIYLLSITVYINWYLPSHYTLENLLNKEGLSFSFFYKRLSEMTGSLLLAGNTVTYYGYFVYIFLTILCFNFFDRNVLNKASLNWLFAMLVVYFGLPFIANLFPLYDLDNSTKRGLFKIFPLMLLFMANSPVLVSLSESIEKWERSK